MGEGELFKYLLEQAPLAGFLLLVIWVLFKRIIRQMDDRIAALEAASDECQKDRTTLHNQIVKIQQDHIAALEKR